MSLNRILRRTSLAIGLMLAAPASANEVVFELTPLGSLEIDVVRSLHPAVVPANLVDELALTPDFDAGGQRWLLPLGRLSAYSTPLSLRVEGDPPHIYPTTPINISLPYRSQNPLKIVIPFLDSFDTERLKTVYRNEAISTTQEDVLSDFVHVTMQIEFLTGGQLPETDDVTRSLAHSLVVYGNSMARLIDETEWFGVPADFETKREMMQRALVKANKDDDFAAQISVDRLQNAKERSEAATHLLYGRYFRAIADLQSDIQCNEIFPISLPFYENLREMPQQKYLEIRKAAKFTRSMVLSETVRCFNLLLSLRDGVLSALKSVVDRKFGGLDASEMRAVLIRYLNDERHTIIREAGVVASIAGPCIPSNTTSDSAIKALRPICSDIAWLSDASFEKVAKNVQD